MFENGICDVGCNNTYCSWDVNECIFSNATYCNDNINNASLCETQWINDGWCDDNCRYYSVCDNDGSDCGCLDGSLCYSYYSEFFIHIGSDDTGESPYLSANELCAVWEYLPLIADGAGSAFDRWNEQNISCIQAFNEVDQNNDSLADVNEWIYTLYDFFQISQEKAAQVNCTQCVTN